MCLNEIFIFFYFLKFYISFYQSLPKLIKRTISLPWTHHDLSGWICANFFVPLLFFLLFFLVEEVVTPQPIRSTRPPITLRQKKYKFPSMEIFLYNYYKFQYYRIFIILSKYFVESLQNVIRIFIIF